jgi:hypothetical protein
LTKVQVSAPFQADFDSKLPLSEWEFLGDGNGLRRCVY